MKVFSAILSIYFLGLALMPCADAHAEHELDELEQILGLEHHSDHDHSSEEDACTPFCVCQCCHTDVVSSSNIVISLVDADLVETVENHKEGILSSYTQSLFQPPRV